MAYNDLTNMLTANPWMFDPSQMSNQFSNYNNARLPGPSYANAPVNAATGQPIASFQQQNPAGMTLNATPAQPAPAPQPQGMTPQQAWTLAQQTGGSGVQGNGRGTISSQGALDVYSQLMAGQPRQAQAPGPTATPSAAPQGNGTASNWQNYLNALANPGKVTTPGATVPLATGSQPAGGVNAAWLNQIGGGQGMNQNFVNALRAIQGR